MEKQDVTSADALRYITLSIERSRAVLKNEEHFCCGVYAMDDQHMPVTPDDLTACKWCMVGAVDKVVDDDVWMRCVALVTLNTVKELEYFTKKYSVLYTTEELVEEQKKFLQGLPERLWLKSESMIEDDCISFSDSGGYESVRTLFENTLALLKNTDPLSVFFQDTIGSLAAGLSR